MNNKKNQEKIKKQNYSSFLSKILQLKGVAGINDLPRVESEKILKNLEKEFLKIPIKDVIEIVNIELTTRCSSNCKFCGRQLDHVKYIVDLPLETFKKVPIEDLELIRLEGTLGDPIHYPFIIDVVKEIRNRGSGDASITLYTNGNRYNEKWWSNLARLFDFNSKNEIMFGLDGLEDTHALHRKGTNFKKIVKNIEAFTSAGGNADVTMIVFKHNEHQIKELKKFCIKIGCRNFYTRVSKKYDDELEKPEFFLQKSRREKTRTEESKGVPVLCGMMHFGQSFLTCDGQLIPCFKWHPRRFFWKRDDEKTRKIYWKNLPYMNLNDHNFYDILKNNFLKHLKNNLQNMKECGDICRTLHDPYLEKK